jgi:L-ascorbate metabolism protein UlaG (beta-lactamase superfamily)
MDRLRPQRIPSSFFEERGNTLVTWLGMAGVLINARGTVLFIDPLITVVEPRSEQRSESGERFKIALPIEAKEVPKADGALYTHADADHFGHLTAATFNARLGPKFLAPPPVRRLLVEAGCDEEHIITAVDFESVQIGNVQVVVTPALHDWQGEKPWQRGDCCGYLVKTPDGTIWHPGDTRLIDDLLEVSGVDVMFYDVAAVDAHLGPAGSAQLAKTSGARILVAYHYGTFDLPPGTYGGCDPDDSLPYVQYLPAQFLVLNPGEPLRLPLGPL